MGENPRKLTKNPGVDHDPAWSPDGKRIAYSSERDRNTDIYVMDTNGRNSQKLTNAGSNYSPLMVS